MNDTELLDFLDKLHRLSGFEACALRQSTTGRGWRLHSLTNSEADALGVRSFNSPRRAIEAYALALRGEREIVTTHDIGAIPADLLSDKYGD